MNISVIKINAKDLESISSLFVSVFCGSPWNENWEYSWAYERLKWILDSDGSIGYLAEFTNITVGAILGNFIPFKGEIRI